MNNEQTNTTDTAGTETIEAVAEPERPVSLYDKTEAIVVRQEEANKKTEELINRQENLFANQRLAGTSGGALIQKSKEEKLTDETKKFIKGEE